MRPFVLLSVLAFVLLAGCLGGLAPGGSAGPATDTVSGTPYPDEVATLPPGPKDRPDPPATFTAERAAEYAIAFEYRYSYNELYPGPNGSVGLSEASCHVESNETAGEGYLVTVECQGYVNEPGSGTETVHADLPPWQVRYYLDADSVVRAELD